MARPTHICPAKGCAIQVPPHKLACTMDWYRLPAYLREEIKVTYGNRRYYPAEHMAAVQVALAWYRNNP